MRAWLAAAIGTALAGAALLASAPYVAPLLIYRPSRLLDPDPRHWGTPTARLVRFHAPDGTALTGWWFAPPTPEAGVVLLAHGRSANVASRGRIGRSWSARGLGVLLFDYRGYGSSAGRPSEAGLNQDALAAYDWIHAQGVAPSRIVVVGQSLGGAPAAYVASRRPCAGLVLISAFTSLPEALADKVSWAPVAYAPWPVNRFDVSAYLRTTSVPVVIAVSRGDGLVPLSNSRRLSRRLRGSAWLEEPQGPHDGLLQEFIDDGRLQPFIEGLLARRASPGR